MSADGGGSNLAHRALSACVFVPVVLAAAWFGGLVLFALVAFVVGRATWELLHMARQADHRPASGIGVALSLAYCLYIQVRGADGGLVWLLTAAVVIALVACLRHGVEGYAGNALLTLGGVSFVGILGTAPLLLIPRLGADGPWMLVALFGCIWLTDAAAYGGGRRWGRRRLVPTISPAKTVVGCLCGLAGGLVPLVVWPRLTEWSLPAFAALLLCVSVAGQVGDLVESAIKRDLGVKDAPALIPGHGGILDRFDSYLFAFPAAYLFLVVSRS